MCRFGQTEVVRFLLERRADAQVTEDSNDFYDGVHGPLHLAVMSDQVPLLLEHGVPLDEKNLYDATSLHLARSAEMERFLVPRFQSECRWGIEAENIEGLTPPHYAVWGGYSVVLRVLVEAGSQRL